MYWYGIQIMWFFIGSILGIVLAAVFTCSAAAEREQSLMDENLRVQQDLNKANEILDKIQESLGRLNAKGNRLG